MIPELEPVSLSARGPWNPGPLMLSRLPARAGQVGGRARLAGRRRGGPARALVSG
jgi:hypothetical protein